MTEDEVFDEVGELLDSADMAMMLPVFPNYDEELQCFLCGEFNSEWMAILATKDGRESIGLHAECASPYMARKDQDIASGMTH